MRIQTGSQLQQLLLLTMQVDKVEYRSRWVLSPDWSTEMRLGSCGWWSSLQAFRCHSGGASVLGMVCYMLICGLSYRQSYHSFPRGMGIEFTHLQSPTEPACGLPHHRAAYQDGVPRSDYLQPDGAGPTVPFDLQQRLVWFGFQVRGWSGLQIPYSVLCLTTFLFSLFCISHFLGFIVLHLWWLKSVRKK